MKKALSLYDNKREFMGNFFKLPKPRQFKVEPRYWDPEKEKREARERRIRSDLGLLDESGAYRPYISREDFRKGFSNGRWMDKKQRQRSNNRLLFIILLLAALVYFMLR